MTYQEIMNRRIATHIFIESRRREEANKAAYLQKVYSEKQYWSIPNRVREVTVRSRSIHEIEY